jgi:hypothetical protein
VFWNVMACKVSLGGTLYTALGKEGVMMTGEVINAVSRAVAFGGWMFVVGNSLPSLHENAQTDADHMIEQIEAEFFHSFTESGNSRPARITCSRPDGNNVDVFVKFLGGVRNREFSLCAELLCALLARVMGLGAPTPFVVNLSPEFLAGIPANARDLVRRSLGLNFGTEMAPTGFSVVPPDPKVPRALASKAADVLAFDVFVQNYDRKGDNPNLLWNGRHMLLIDHEGAFNPMLQERTPSLDSLELDRFYDHVFYTAIGPNDANYEGLAKALARLDSARVEDFLGQIPAEWQIGDGLTRVREHLAWLAQNCNDVCELIRGRLT